MPQHKSQAIAVGVEPAPRIIEPLTGASLADRLANSLEARVDALERRIIQDCLQRNNFRRKETAAELSISRVTLYNKMKKFGLL